MISRMAQRFYTAVGVLLLGLAAVAAPGTSYAQRGGGHGGGGGHVGGAHFGGGGHFGGGARFAPGPHVGGGVHIGGAAHYAVPRAGFAGPGAFHYVRPGYAVGYRGPSRTIIRTRPYVGYRAGYVWHGGYYHPYWVGGYWRGAYWPRVYYGGAFAWFLPVLPLGYSVYWWGGIPYYYYNNVYYTYSTADSGYVVTDPPPVAGEGGTAAPANAAPARGAGDIYVYPRNGQSEEQTSTDKYECHKWSVGQTGFDPTVSNSGGNAADYRRAMETCLDARGYSAK